MKACYSSIRNLLDCLKNIQNINSSSSLYGCENVVTHMKGRKLAGVFEDKVLRKIFEPKVKELTGALKKLNNQGIYDLQ